jgi:hypothetical protein
LGHKRKSNNLIPSLDFTKHRNLSTPSGCRII